MTTQRAAYYYPATKRRPAIFDVVEHHRDNMGRANGSDPVLTLEIEGLTRRQAREIAAQHNAEPWNF